MRMPGKFYNKLTNLFLIRFFAHVVENVLHVFVFLNFFKELVHAFAFFGSNVLEVVGDAFEFGRNDFETVIFEVLLDICIFFESTVENDFVFIMFEFIDTVIDEFEFEDRKSVV